ncbi:hypothetical protein SAMN05192533_105143 [Mesobacillus persicus]|uniref:Uncharacterized protein n=1 Tax=Mesobacillus persicus TaxID=930146 RepID=A0A1H8AWE4_9BACI|nr:hypothetical protein [Mesobacillus persicus]SEM73817.1 hypothetical protein SAMN05192533_105143 [Mesobacillus persicus]
MGYQSEAQLEKKLHTHLVNKGYIPVKITDYDALLANFKNQT